jgi:23S rRNA (guanine1835-N2)-methyltransferase
MNTEFSMAERQFTLIRYPEKHQHKSLQAWDSADELLIEHVEAHLEALAASRNEARNEAQDENQTETSSTLGPILIFNDDFGTLGCWFTQYNPIWISDSYISLRSLQENLRRNHLKPVIDEAGALTSPVTSLTSVESLTFMPESAPSVIMLKVPRTLALLEQQLIDIKRYAAPGTHIVAAGKIKAVTKSVSALFEKIIGPAKTSLAKKKSRLVFSTLDESISSIPSPYPETWECKGATGQTFVLKNHANVFSRQSLDIGARLMLEHMTVSANETVVDLGCGNGILGLNALALAGDCKVIFIDESFMAVESARLNVLENFPEKIDQCEFIASNCLESLLEQQQSPWVTKILCNPPFHQQNAITDHIAWQMFNDSKHALVKGGQLVVVGNRHLEHHVKLKRMFGGSDVLASDKKFVILGTAKR